MVEERLGNGGFESGLAGWNVPSSFTSVISANGSMPRSGAMALVFDGDSRNSVPYVDQTVAVSPGQRVDFSGWVNMPVRRANMSVVVELTAVDQNGRDLKTYVLGRITGATDGWTSITNSAVMPSGTAAVRLRVQAPRLSGTAYVDDLSLRY